MTFSQQTFAESLKLPFPLLSDSPDRKAMRSYGVLNEKTALARTMTAEMVSGRTAE